MFFTDDVSDPTLVQPVVQQSISSDADDTTQQVPTMPSDLSALLGQMGDAGAGDDASQDLEESPKKSTMDILDEILKESEQEESSEAAAAAAEEAAKEAEKEAKIAAYEQAVADQRAKDAVLIGEQLSELKTIEITPENQARLQQIEEAKAQQAQATVAADGFEILQIDHTKIPVVE